MSLYYRVILASKVQSDDLAKRFVDGYLDG